MKPYYEHAGVTIYYGDCREVMPQINFDVIVADPPYGIGKDYGPNSVDDVATFQWAVQMIADTGKPSSVCLNVSRLYDLPRRPQWTGVWSKPLSMSALIAYPVYPHWEPIAFYHIKGNFAGNKGHRSDIFECSPEPKRNFDHPTPKPVDLMMQLIKFLPEGVVLDPFAGSGATLAAARNLERSAIGIEIEEKYCEVIAKRFEQEVFDFSQCTASA